MASVTTDSWSTSSIDKISDVKLKKLVQASLDARKPAYAPYSKFYVGCAILASDGTIVKGCNVENACYGLGVCAEVVAVSKAISESATDFSAIAIAAEAPPGQFTSPCGRCRQFMAEFADLQTDIYLVRPDNIYRTIKLADLLPLAFTPKTLREATIQN